MSKKLLALIFAALLFSFASCGSPEDSSSEESSSESVSESASESVESGKAIYKIRFVDENGANVVGVEAQICDKSSEVCRNLTDSDGDSVYTFEIRGVAISLDAKDTYYVQLNVIPAG